MAIRPTAAFHEATSSISSALFHIAEEHMATIVIFGATGDLAQRKLIPAIYHLWRGGYLPKRLAVVGVSRRDLSDDVYREMMCEALKKFSRTASSGDDSCDPFVGNLYYHSLNFAGDEDFSGLGERLEQLEKKLELSGNRLFYLSTAPDFFPTIIDKLGAANMVRNGNDSKWARVVIEKPFGHDLESARALNAEVQSVLGEDQIFRIDHYLGKETVQNIFAFRFGNAIFEPLFNQKYVDHVQITVAETIGMEGRRGEFYDKTGALRDVVQNHALQLMCLVAMEPPAIFNAKQIRDEKVKVLTSTDLPKQDPRKWLIRGQYTEGRDIKGYLNEQGVASDSLTETFVALKLFVDNWRWAGVPFFIRHGKYLKKRVTEIVIQFRHPPTHYFKHMGVDMPDSNVLVFRIQPDEAISLRFSAKPPGMEFQIQPVDMDFNYGHAFQKDMPDAYERLILDALRGDSTLFTRADEIENAWRIVTDILHIWETQPPPELYRPGTWGPSAADRLFEGCQGCWRSPD